MFQERIVVEQINYSRMRPQTLLQIFKHAPQSGFWKWIEEIEYGGSRRKIELSCVRANRLECEAFLRVAPILAKILHGNIMERGQEFYSDDAKERIVGRHQKRAPLARAEIDEDEVTKIQVCLLMQSIKHLAKQSCFGGLIRRMEDAEQTVAPAYRCACRVDSMFPIKFGVAVALTAALRSRVADEVPE